MKIEAHLNKNVLTSEGDWYGPLRKMTAPLPECWSEAFARAGVEPLAEDENGNFFVQHQDRRIGFWDHETDELIWLAKDEESFASIVTTNAPGVALSPDQVVRVWVNPDFKPEFD